MNREISELADQVVRTVNRFRYRFNNERELQDQLATAFAGYVVNREHELRPLGRVDFFFPHLSMLGVALEVKVGGPAAAVARQLIGYAQHGEVGELILVTSRMRLGNLVPEQLNGKRVQVVALSWGGL